MRIVFAGATGVLGRTTLPHLSDHDVVALTRSRERLPLLQELGAEAARLLIDAPAGAYDVTACARAGVPSVGMIRFSPGASPCENGHEQKQDRWGDEPGGPEKEPAGE